MCAIYYQWSAHTGSLMQLKLLATHSFLNVLSFVSWYPPGNVLPVATSTLCSEGGSHRARQTSAPGFFGGLWHQHGLEWVCFFTSHWFSITGSPWAFSIRFQPEVSPKKKPHKPQLKLELCGISDCIWCRFKLCFKWSGFQVLFRAWTLCAVYSCVDDPLHAEHRS